MIFAGYCQSGRILYAGRTTVASRVLQRILKQWLSHPEQITDDHLAGAVELLF